MPLTKIKEVNSITVLASGHLQVQMATVILEDGKELSRTFHRSVVEPGDDLSKEDSLVAKIGAVVHTAALVTAFQIQREDQLKALTAENKVSKI